ncbi:extracellular solute-binding protein [Streptomyces europaeiscabiei]|uniref:extracellular solute-binding protein n=2 Tax=Streptomyces TaxID=1883 RepID=UPI000A372FDA|nr:extracellular solute-binding protein [Streptomyces europaeiscabiei]MDX3616735.1 extracellular solute-binding protein [Streptomyces europaeiscabiei]MDX3635238.1 extracellular solute-binding protein [Streptomyces europaeiscabiei]MDX3650222.1 extracellular solute-binding protein [Streptomyces europaeiscabiei]
MIPVFVRLANAEGMAPEERHTMRGIPVIGDLRTPGIRRAVASTVALSAALGLAACGTSGPSTTSSEKGLTMWALNDQTILKESVDAYNEDHPDEKITLRLFANDDYKQKLRVAFGANQAPDIFFSWGGGALNDYVEAGKVDALKASDVKTDRFTPSVMQSATFEDKVYGVPANGLAPVVLYYNKKVLADAGVEPPKTYDDLLAAVKKLKAKDVVPLSLAANSKWPTLMYLEYLLDREGGSEVFTKIASGDASAWKDPSVTKANQRLQDLAKAGAFGDNASSVNYDQGASTALLYTGKAAMEVMGTWEYANIAKAAPDLLKKGDLGYTAFPSMPDGTGDPQSIVGNPSNFLSLNSSSKHKSAALTYLEDYVLNDSQVDAYLAAGSVPPVNGLEAKLAAVKSSSDKEWLTFVYGLVQNAPSFQLSWDQALPSDQADPLLTNTDKSFLRQIPPAEFGTNMSRATS